MLANKINFITFARKIINRKIISYVLDTRISFKT